MSRTHDGLDGLFRNIADSIRGKTGSSASIVADNFPTAIDAIPTGVTPTGNIELTQQSGTNVADYATASVRNGSVTLNTPTVNSSGVVTSSASVGTSGWVGSAPSNATLQLSTQAAKTVTPSASAQTAVASGKYTTGTVTVAAVPTETKSMTLGAAAPSSVTPTSGKFLSSVSPSIDTSVIKAENIAQGATILGVAGTHQGGITPTGTKTICLNSLEATTVDVTNYANASITVGTITSTGESGTDITLGPSAVAFRVAMASIPSSSNNRQMVDTYLDGNTMNIVEVTKISGGSRSRIAVDIESDQTPIPSLYYYNANTGDEVSVIDSDGRLVSVEPKSYYSIYNRSLYNGHLYFNGTLEDDLMHTQFSELDYYPYYETGLLYHPIWGCYGGNNTYGYLIAVNAESVSPGLRILGVQISTDSDDYYFPVYATQAFNILGFAGIQGWQNLDLDISSFIPSGSLEATEIYLEAGSTLELVVKDIIAFQPVCFGPPRGLPIEISTDAGMTAVLTAANVGKAYKFTGTTGTYTNGDIYVVEEA